MPWGRLQGFPTAKVSHLPKWGTAGSRQGAGVDQVPTCSACGGKQDGPAPAPQRFPVEPGDKTGSPELSERASGQAQPCSDNEWILSSKDCGQVGVADPGHCRGQLYRHSEEPLQLCC